MRQVILSLLTGLGALCHPASAQQGVTTFGIQVKPVFPTPLFGTETRLARPSLRGAVDLEGGLAFGMSVRVGLTKTISFETGIAQIQRRFSFSLSNDTSGYSETGSFRFVGFEVPITALAYVRMGERTYMNAAMGFSADLYPSDVQQELQEGNIYVFRNRWSQVGVVGNLGVEYRSTRSGILYFGVTFRRPFGDMAIADLTYWDVRNNFFPYPMRAALNGSYITTDIRYYFHEDPDRLRRK